MSLGPGEAPEKYQTLPGGGGPVTPDSGDRRSKILAPLRAEGARGVLVAVISTVVVFTLIVLGMVGTVCTVRIHGYLQRTLSALIGAGAPNPIS